MINERNIKATVRVAAPVIEAEIPVCTEVMNALPDPADADQAILASVPVLTDAVNYGDIVRLGPADDLGVRPITEVIVPSGHVHLLAAAAEGEALDLVAELERRFPAYGLRFARASESVVSVSVHPDLDAGRVGEVIADWLGADPEREGEMPALTDPAESEVGLIAWV